MAGGAQGGARPAQPGVAGGQTPPINPQAGQQFQNALQNYRQGSMGMPSQVPGANVAAPGGGMPQGYGPPQQMQPMYAGPAPVPQQVPPLPPQAQGNPQLSQVNQALQQMPPEQQQRMEALGAQIRAQQGMAPQAQSQVPPEVLQRYLSASRGLGGRPQILGNPNAMPLQRPQR